MPNNEGVALATGRRLAFLNHDDLWFTDHLAILNEALDMSDADLAYSCSAGIDARGDAHLWGNSPGWRYAPWHPVPASVWMMRREPALRVGPWTNAARLFNAPSHEWIRRAARSGATLRPVPRLTAAQITSGGGRTLAARVTHANTSPCWSPCARIATAARACSCASRRRRLL